MVPPCPWNTLSSSPDNALTWSGSSARNSGRNPPISASMSSAGDGSFERNRLSRLQFAHRARAVFEGQIPVADQVLVADGCPGALGQRQPFVDRRSRP